MVQNLYLGSCVHRKKYLHSFYKQGGDFLCFERKKILIFSVDQLTVISSLWWTKDCNLFKNPLTVFSLLMQNRISTKVNFLDSANKNLGIISSHSFCLSIVFLINLANDIVKTSSREICEGIFFCNGFFLLIKGNADLLGLI